MLRAYYSMPAADFIAQLRTYVIAMDLSPQVVDAVDNLTGIDEMQESAAQDAAVDMKKEILGSVDMWCDSQPDFPEKLKKSLLAAIREAEI